MDVRMSTSGTRLMLPCAMVTAPARRADASLGEIATPPRLFEPHARGLDASDAESDVGAIDQRVDETHLELIHLLDDRLPPG